MPVCRLVYPLHPGIVDYTLIAGLLNEEKAWAPLSRYAEPVTPSMVEAWFGGPGFDAGEAAACMGDSGALYGLAWLRLPHPETPGRVGGVAVHLKPGPWSGGVALSLLGVAREALASAGAPVTMVYLGYKWGPSYRVLSRLVRGVEKPVGGIMEHPEPRGLARAYRLPEGYRLVEARPWEEPWDAAVVAEVFNDAFEGMGLYRRWSPEQAQAYYRTLRRERPRVRVLLALDPAGRPAGLVEAYPHPTIGGGTAGYVSLLAVKRAYRGRGLARGLLARAVEALLEAGAGNVYLDAVQEAVGFYERLGFTLILQDTAVPTPTPAIPGPTPTLTG